MRLKPNALHTPLSGPVHRRKRNGGADARDELNVGLPGGINGRKLADAARVSRPDLKVPFITGHAGNAAIGNGLLESGMKVITKPFAVAAMGNKVREMLDR